MSAEMYSDIVFTGDRLNPDACTKSMGLVPSKSYRKGQRHGPLLLMKDTGGWWYTTKRCACNDISEENKRSLDVLVPRQNAIAALKEEYQLNLNICTVIEICELPYPRLFWSPAFFTALSVLQVDNYNIDWYDLEQEEHDEHDPMETSAKAWIEEDGSNVVLHDTGWMPTVFLEELMCKCLDHAKGKAIQTKSATMHIDIEVHNDERVVMEFSRRLIKRMKSMALGLAVDWKCI